MRWFLRFFDHYFVTAGYEEAFKLAWSVKPDSPVGIFIEEGYLLSPEYLSFLVETVDVLLKDNSILGVSGFNPLCMLDHSITLFFSDGGTVV